MANRLSQGELFDGRYRLERPLGIGGMAEVWLARDEELGRKVAIKVLHDRHLKDDSFRERFYREATAAASLSHPNIVQIYDRGECDGYPYIVMEVVLGPDLKDLVKDKGALPLPRAVGYTRQVLAALMAAHGQSIVHRDVKPQNVLIGDDGRLRVTDFGIARSPTSQLTEAGSLVGTASYIAPEQAQGQEVGPAADLYATGVLLYELVTGRLPFEGPSSLEVAMQHVSTPPPRPLQFRPDLPPSLEAAILHALEKDPAKRYASAADFDAALGEIEAALAADDESLTAVLPAIAPAEPFTPVPARERFDQVEVEEPRRPWPWLLAAALLFVIVAVASVGYLASQSGEPEAAEAEPSVATLAVPRLVGLSEDEARDKLEESGLKAEIERSFSATYPEGQVTAQAPTAGAQLKRGATVTLTVSRGREMTDVPDVVGLSSEEAVQALEANGLKARLFEVPSDEPEGTVVAQSPKDGQLAKGATVRLNVSAGREQATVPDVRGLSADEATSQLEAAGLGASVFYVPSDQPRDAVVAQNPPAGATVAMGRKVRLNVSDGSRVPAPTPPPTPPSEPAEEEIPDVVGLDEEEARQTLADAGFNYASVDQTTDDPSQDGVVLAQDPSGKAEEGTTVTITIGRYQEPEEPAETNGASSP